MASWAILRTTGPVGEWRTNIDAYACKVLKKRNTFKSAGGRIFDPTPVAQLNDIALGPKKVLPITAYREVELSGLSSSGYLDGPHVSTKPVSHRIERTNGDFNFLLAYRAFEEVMVYYHIDRAARHLIDMRATSSSTKNCLRSSLLGNFCWNQKLDRLWCFAFDFWCWEAGSEGLSLIVQPPGSIVFFRSGRTTDLCSAMANHELDALRYPIGKFTYGTVAATSQRLAQCVGMLEGFPHLLRKELENVTEAQLIQPYRPGGWTVKQVVHHLADSHMNALIRFKLALSEEDPTIKPYLQDRWCEQADVALPVAPSLMILDGVHLRWVALLKSMSAADFDRTYYHPEQQRSMPLNEVIELYVWHGRHHLAHVVGANDRNGGHG